MLSSLLLVLAHYHANLDIMRTLLLAGGGLCHALCLPKLRARLPEDVRLLLISLERFMLYPAMLPGLVAGDYRFRDCHIDLGSLCHSTDTELVFGRLEELDLDNRRAQLGDGRELSFDLLSLNIGLDADTRPAGVAEQALSLKPLSQFLPHWQQTLERLYARGRTEPAKLGIVGGGVQAMELALAIRHQLQHDPRLKAPVEVHLIHSGSKLLPEFPLAGQIRGAQLLQQRQVRDHPLFLVTRIESGELFTDRNQHLPMDEVLWCEPGRATAFLDRAQLSTTERGLVEVNRHLQSISHPQVFAVGDMAAGADTPVQSDGLVLRQAPVLADNLLRQLSREPLQAYKPAHQTLSIVNASEDYALARFGNWVCAGAWVWRWKRYRDLKFMAQFPRA